MLAIGVVPGRPDSAELIELPDPDPAPGEVLVRGRLVGICGTDADIVYEGYGSPPEGSDRLVLGHESLGEVVEAPPASGLARGDLVAAVVRRPDPVPCPWCARGEWDMCRNGLFVEHGILGAHGYGSEWWSIEPSFAVKLDPALGDLGVLLEPTSVVAKAWEQVERIGARSYYAPETALVTGAGPVGLLAAMLARQRGLETWVLDRAKDGPKPELVADLGAIYTSEPASQLPVAPDVVIECTGSGSVLTAVVDKAAPNAVISLAGISHHGDPVETDLEAINRRLVLHNQVVFGTVNAARRHHDQAAQALASADPAWLGRLLTRTVPLASWTEALSKTRDDIKVTVAIGGPPERIPTAEERS
jgi:threonine dehydrogenase-like Zn-dependent dehydrogenase